MLCLQGKVDLENYYPRTGMYELSNNSPLLTTRDIHERVLIPISR